MNEEQKKEIQAAWDLIIQNSKEWDRDSKTDWMIKGLLMGRAMERILCNFNSCCNKLT